MNEKILKDQEVYCSNCYFIKDLKTDMDKAEICAKKTKTDIESLQENKVSWGHFKWVLGALVTAALIVFGWNVNEIKALQKTVDQINITQQLMQKDIQTLMKK